PLHFRRRPPQSNCPPDTVSRPDYGSELEAQNTKGGISRWTPRGLASPLHSLPPILDKMSQTPISSCSKGSRGLSVLLRVIGIFTDTTIPPSPSLIQRPSRYAIRAGRNLPDKEFRYLRTVIVTAAVYRGLDSKLRPKANLSSRPSGTREASAPIRLLTTSQRPVFLVNSRLGRFTATPSSSNRKGCDSTGVPLLPKLRGHFAEFLNEGSSDRLGILYLPTCVGFGTGTTNLPRGFSRRHGFKHFGPKGPRRPVSGLWPADFPTSRPTRVPQVDQRLGCPSLPRPPIGHNDWDVVQEYQPVVHRLRLSASA